MSDKCFCHLNGYKVKDADARKSIETLNKTTTNISNDVTILENRMNTFTALPEGSTTADSELLDIRNGADGVVYDTAGESVRKQFDKTNYNYDELRKRTVNMFNPNDSEIEYNGYYLHNNTLSTIPAGYGETGFIPCKAGDVIRGEIFSNTVDFNAIEGSNILFYNSKKEYIIGYQTEMGITEYTVPNNNQIAFFRVPCKLDIKDTYLITVNNETPTKFTPYYKYNFENVNSEIEHIKKFCGITSINMFNPNDSEIEYNGYYLHNNTLSTDPAGYGETGFIPCKAGDVINATYFGVAPYEPFDRGHICFYNSNKEYVMGEITLGITQHTVPNNSDIAYFRTVLYLSAKNYLFITVNSDLPENIYTEIDKSKNQWLYKKWYAYGTSITNTAGEGKYATYLQRLSKLIFTNKGISGGGICVNTNNKTAIMNTTDGKLDADLITFEVGANDYEATIGSIYDLGNDTLCGALNQCIRYLLSNTNAQIVVMSSPPIVRYTPNSETLIDNDYTFGDDNHTVFDMREAIRKVCELNGVYYIPVGESSGMGYSRQIAHTDLTQDGVHPSNLGGYNIAQFIWSKLKNIPLWYTEIPEL